MILDATTKKLQVVLAGAITTNQLPVVSSWVDMTTTATTPGSTTTASNSTTQVDIVAAPAASTQRVVQSVSVYNKDTVNATVTIIMDDTGTDREIVKVLLQPGQSLVYTTGVGWQVVAATQSGANYASFVAHKNGTDQTGITASTNTKVTFTTELFDIGGYYDAANSKWTPPAGKVVIAVQVTHAANIVADQQVLLKIYKNGAEYKTVFLFPATSSSTPGISFVIIDSANGTDYYEIYTYADGAGDKTVSGSTTYTFFSGSSL